MVKFARGRTCGELVLWRGGRPPGCQAQQHLHGRARMTPSENTTGKATASFQILPEHKQATDLVNQCGALPNKGTPASILPFAPPNPLLGRTPTTRRRTWGTGGIRERSTGPPPQTKDLDEPER